MAKAALVLGPSNPEGAVRTVCTGAANSLPCALISPEVRISPGPTCWSVVRIGQLDFLSNEGYSKLGVPDGYGTNLVNPLLATTISSTRTGLGLSFQPQRFLRGILEKISFSTAQNIHGAVIPAPLR